MMLSGSGDASASAQSESDSTGRARTAIRASFPRMRVRARSPRQASSRHVGAGGDWKNTSVRALRKSGILAAVGPSDGRAGDDRLIAFLAQLSIRRKAVSKLTPTAPAPVASSMVF